MKQHRCKNRRTGQKKGLGRCTSAYTRKVYFIGDQKFYIKGVTYGAFAPGENGIEFHDFATIERDFAAGH
jgi:hypothetical protein